MMRPMPDPVEDLRKAVDSGIERQMSEDPFFRYATDSKFTLITGGDLVKFIGGIILWEVRGIDFTGTLVTLRQASDVPAVGHVDCNGNATGVAIVKRTAHPRQLVKQVNL